jgi:UDP-GlcNAc:undecaprenyl-phosphate GlcNAc-1-phosphate transferase
MLIILVLCASASLLGCAFLLRAGQENARRYGEGMPQRFHTGHVPRLGGAAMLGACALGWTWMVVAQPYLGIPNGIRFAPSTGLHWLLVTVIGTTLGLMEDLTHRLSARLRLAGSVVAAAAAAVIFQLSMPRTGVPGLEALWQLTPWLGIGIAVLAVAGLPHAFNIIDGYNGLAAMVALICCLSIAYVAMTLGDRHLAAVLLALAGATAGFLVWNYPHGVIFAGDGGAYLWGTVISVAVIQLVQRHAEVSPWFPVLLLIYPIWETFFSIFRKLTRGQSPGLADALHFHQLIYRRVVRQVFHDDEARRMLIRNNRTSPYLWGFTLLTVVPATLFWNSTPMLVAFTVLFVASYIWCYFNIIRFRMQRWVHRRR